MLTNTIQNSIAAIKLRRTASDSKSKAEAYIKALKSLDKAINSTKATLDCVIELKAQDIVVTPILPENLKSDLLSCIDACGNGISPESDEPLSLETVKLLQSKGDAVLTLIKLSWKENAGEYSKGPAGYLSMIANLTDNPKQAKDLVERIKKTVEGSPSTEAISDLVSDVSSAKKIIEGFSISPEIENFLMKVSNQQATLADLTSNITKWLKEKKLMGKLKLRF